MPAAPTQDAAHALLAQSAGTLKRVEPLPNCSPTFCLNVTAVSHGAQWVGWFSLLACWLEGRCCQCSVQVVVCSLPVRKMQLCYTVLLMAGRRQCWAGGKPECQLLVKPHLLPLPSPCARQVLVHSQHTFEHAVRPLCAVATICVRVQSGEESCWDWRVLSGHPSIMPGQSRGWEGCPHGSSWMDQGHPPAHVCSGEPKDAPVCSTKKGLCACKFLPTSPRVRETLFDSQVSSSVDKGGCHIRDF